jgi:starch synthase (maltosyl-transferring)
MTAPTPASDKARPNAPNWIRHLIIEDVTPAIDGGRHPAKRITGEPCVVEADIFRDGHQVIRAALKYRQSTAEGFAEAPMILVDNDRWRGAFVPENTGTYIFTIDAWTDAFASWLADFGKKVLADKDARADLLEGVVLLKRIAESAPRADQDVLRRCVSRLQRAPTSLRAALEFASDPVIAEIAQRCGDRVGVVRYEPALQIVADRPKARFSSWYEMFPRSQSQEPGKASTLREAERRLPVINDMGFDVVYLPPIHPIGVTNRKGRNNTLHAGANDPGSPWAIGSSAGGHDAVHPALGNLEDFQHFVTTARSLGIETAIDFAVQCSPDHPWVRRHPEWFIHRPDGTIRYAENPPKEYQDIYPIDFDTVDQPGLTQELLRIVRFWIDQGVTIFRVDNPHTKPVAFWEWLINAIKRDHPEVLFLAEAFTRPKMMRILAKAGFSQSYTYFTWRNTKSELVDYLTELTKSPIRDYFRPNFFTNTPDILPPILQTGGPPAFKLRLVLAATLGSSYGIYSGFELCEHAAIPGTEEPLNSEKYEIKVRDWHQPGNICEFLAQVNAIRKNNPALQEFLNLQFLPSDSDQILCYSKSTMDHKNDLLIAVNLDPTSAHYCTVSVPPEILGVRPGQAYRVTDLLTGATYTWTDHNYVRLDPEHQPAHILRVDARL